MERNFPTKRNSAAIWRQIRDSKRNETMAEIKKVSNVATSQEIRSVLGPIDDETVVIIQATGATIGEILQACIRSNNEVGTSTEMGHQMNGSTLAVYEILRSIEEDAV